MLPLPVISCEKCNGACCREQSVLPVLWYYGNATEERRGILPQHLQEELQFYLSLWDEAKGRITGPCVWLDVETGRCLHYSFRPGSCRNFPVGELGCRTMRTKHYEGV